MSRIGSNPVAIPDGVEMTIAGQIVTAKGKLGERSMTVDSEIEIVQGEGDITLRPRSEQRHVRSMWGTTRSLLDNLVRGVSEGFVYNLEIQGVGYRAQVQGKTLELQLGFSHDINYPIPEGISMACERPTKIAVSGSDKQQVGQVAAEIRAFRPPEPYKGKGIRYEGEYVLRKEGKKK